MRFEIAAGKILGSRKVQEDAWRLRALDGRDLTAEAERPTGVQIDNGALVVIADGMGGHGGGDVASRIACEQFAGAYFQRGERPPNDRLDFALKAANGAIADAKTKDAVLKQMGCTLIAAHLGTDKMTFVSVGDSLLIRVRGNEVHRVNEDHSNHLALDLRALEADSDEAWRVALSDQQRYSITSAVTGKPLTIREIDTRKMEAGDILIFATDGLETLDYQQIRAIVSKRRDKGVAAVRDWLLKATDRIGAGGRQDNTTVIVVRSLNGAASQAVAAAAVADPEVTQIRSAAPAIEHEVTEIRPAAAPRAPIAPQAPAPRQPIGGPAGAAPAARVQPLAPASVKPGSNKVLVIAGLLGLGIVLAGVGAFVLTRHSNQDVNRATTTPQTTVQPPAPVQVDRKKLEEQKPGPSTPQQQQPQAPPPTTSQPQQQIISTPPQQQQNIPTQPQQQQNNQVPAPAPPAQPPRQRNSDPRTLQNNQNTNTQIQVFDRNTGRKRSSSEDFREPTEDGQ